MNARWDDKLQRYVRRDGIRLGEKPNPPARNWNPPDFNNIHAEISLQRHGVSDYVLASVNYRTKGSGPWLPEVLTVIDVSTGKPLGSIAINEDGFERLSAEGVSRFLAGKATTGQGWSGGSSRSIVLAPGARARVELRTRDHVETSPVLRP